MPNLKVTNTTQGPRYLHALEGTKVLKPGETYDGAFSDGEAKNLQQQMNDKQPYFSVAQYAGEAKTQGTGAGSTSKKLGEEDFSKMTAPELRAAIEKRDGKAPSEALHKGDLLAMATGDYSAMKVEDLRSFIERRDGAAPAANLKKEELLAIAEAGKA